MPYEADKHGLNPPAYIRYAEGLVDISYDLLQDPKCQGPNFDVRSFPMGELVAAALRDDEVIDASPEEIETARRLARERWASSWGLDLSELTDEET